MTSTRHIASLVRPMTRSVNPRRRMPSTPFFRMCPSQPGPFRLYCAEFHYVHARRPRLPPRRRNTASAFMAMHPPRFSFEQHLSDWPECYLELTCCKGYIVMPVRLLLKKHGDRTFNVLLRQLRCDRCGNHPAPVYLCASHFRSGNTLATTADWAVELVPPPSDRRWEGLTPPRP
jgi:hypothetical protein